MGLSCPSAFCIQVCIHPLIMWISVMDVPSTNLLGEIVIYWSVSKVSLVLYMEKTKEHRPPAVPLPTSGCGRLGNTWVEEEKDGKSPPKSAACKIFPCLAGVQSHNTHSASDSAQGLPPILCGLLWCLKMSFSWGWRATRERRTEGLEGREERWQGKTEEGAEEGFVLLCLLLLLERRWKRHNDDLSVSVRTKKEKPLSN